MGELLDVLDETFLVERLDRVDDSRVKLATPLRRAEERHDPVAHHLVNGALVAMHGFHHPFEHRVEDLPRFLGVTVGEQLYRALEVGEERTVTCLPSPSNALFEVR